MDYLYDGTFEGLLTCIFFHYKIEKASGIYEINSYQQTIINAFKTVETDEQKAKVVSDAIENKISHEAYVYIYYCFLSSIENKCNLILDFLMFAFKYGKKTMNFYTHEHILPIQEAYIKVSREVHKFRGILRFSEIDKILYAKYSPDNDITVLLMDHFIDRYKYEKFMIHDAKRKKAALYANGQWLIKEADDLNNIEVSDEETIIQNLWKQYFNDMAIKERTNINLQFQFVPARYRKNMAEFN